MKIKVLICSVVLLILFGAGAVFCYANDSEQEHTYTISPSDSTAAINNVVKKLDAGDVLYIKSGTYEKGIVFPKNVKGTSKKHIKVHGENDKSTVVKDARTLIEVKGASYLDISDMKLCDSKHLDACGILVDSGSHDINLCDNEICNITAPSPKTRDHCANGILLYGDSAKNGIYNISICRNYLHDCMTGWAECISAEGNVRKVSVKDNTVDDTGNIGIDLSGNYGYCKNVSLDFPRNCTVSGNTVRNCRSSYGDTAYGIYIDGGQKISVSENDVSNCSGGIEIGAEQKPKSERYSTGSIKITKNKIENNIENGITIGGYEKKLGNVRHVDIVGNICLENGCKSGAILTLSKCCYINVSKNRLQNTKGNAYVVYSDFHKRYTNHLHFHDNIYCNGHNANDTAFEYLGKNYSSFARWKSVAGKSAGTYVASKSLKKTLQP